ncbi:hypothetical protein GCM10022243_39430 [Saccharothrix violaceirubra]
MAMLVGVELLAPAWEWAGQRPDVVALVTATDMTVAMALWMRYRGHPWPRVVEMGAAMFLPYLVLLVPHWLGVLDGEHVLTGGHVLMLPAMVAAMLVHREEYTRPHGESDAHPLVKEVGRRGPTWIALAMTFDQWTEPLVPWPVALLVLPGAYLVFGMAKGHLRDRRVLAAQLAGLVAYAVLAVVASNADPRMAAWLVAAGWGLHAVWDVVHHRLDRVVPRWWAEWCAVVDFVVAATILSVWL